MTNFSGTFSIPRGLLILVACFLSGWGAAEVDGQMLRSAKALFAETYLNKFNAMSGADIDEYVYHVISDDPLALQQIADQTGGIRRVEATALPTVFNAYIAATARREMLSRLRAMTSVTAVFTVPFMCH